MPKIRLTREPSAPRQMPAMRGDLLMRVLPIVEMQTHNRYEVLVISLELYDDGALLTYRVRDTSQLKRRFFQSPPDHGMLRLRVSDDLGQDYDASTMSIRTTPSETRGEARIVPLPQNGATFLIIEAEIVSLESFGMDSGPKESDLVFRVAL